MEEMKDDKKLSTVELGRIGEDTALKYLLEKGLWLRDRNWRVRHLEIDLVMEDEKRLHIVEVRTRRRHDPIEPKDTVDNKKQQRLIRAASSYIFRNNIQKETVFDIVSVTYDNDYPEIEYIEDAFFPICRVYR